MNDFLLENRLDKIEKLLTATKAVLTFEEACSYTNYSSSYMYKLTSSQNIPHSKPNGKAIFFDRLKLEAWLLRNHRKSKTEIEDEASAYALRNNR
ncbi:helix-turn-helix domain-containing protein [Zobellia galactanivorans]|uniref:helix-turn-helix domain-containing protein n=1 Tax=Zobellia galactanivorans (strain DSM 12802 / CCUG 47099 / CIP 106680 / NCIMB 13871 / Dsij) TaxID=63186 RepID=UPI001C07A539|nr:helix-turn-helix domain-containing protein [Zobellia galactanivorans]MBU3025914.1 helix-turn-helix domain-containing protein [Zobellia galactanivorans]